MAKGQIWSLDLGASVTIFMLAFIILTFTWGYVRRQADDQQSLVTMRDSALTVADLLVRTPGYPSNWTNQTVQSVGLATQSNLLSEQKVLQFIKLNYTASFDLLQLGAYRYKFQLKYPNGTVVMINGTPAEAGENFTGSESSVAQRYALLDSGTKKRVVLQLVVWK